jgi:membrane protein DedA with SNARE-associated domain
MIPVSPNWLPLGFLDWPPALQALSLGLLTFVQEDIPTVGAALLGTAGSLSWQVGFLGVFLGIWLGDTLLYLLARGLGRPLLQYSWSQRFFDPVAIARSERWFSEKGTALLFTSRFIPGTRLPTYLAAGFLRLPLGQFLSVTGAAVLIWTGGIFVFARIFGSVLLQWSQRWNSAGWLILPLVLLTMLLLRSFGSSSTSNMRQRFTSALKRWTHWEFWPAWLFYFPVGLHYAWLAIRYRGLTVPTAANPGIFSGGLVGESKIVTLRDLLKTSPEFTAEAALLEGTGPADRLASLHRHCEDKHLSYPFVLKPDVGQRGVGVKLIRSAEQAAAYLHQSSAPLVVQRYAPGPLEVGIFYYRFPHEPHGRIFAITEKVFPTITGDGRSTVEELIWTDPRARLVASTYLGRLSERKSEILPAGATIRLVEAGNHAQGCIFRDGGWLWSEALERRIDEISQRLDGFYIGRYDIRYASNADLKAGQNFSIIELNGAASEATSIYDARNSLFSAYRTLFRQWDLVFAIGAANRRGGLATTNLLTLWRTWRATNRLIATYPSAD